MFLCIIKAITCLLLVFNYSKNLICIVALYFFEDLYTFFMIVDVMILVTPKHEVERKTEWFCVVKCFLTLKWSEKNVFEQNFSFLAFLFSCSIDIDIDIYYLFGFFIRLILKGFSIFPFDSNYILGQFFKSM